MISPHQDVTNSPRRSKGNTTTMVNTRRSMLSMAIFVMMTMMLSTSMSVVYVAAAADKGAVHVPVHNLRNLNQGKLHIGLFDRDGITNRYDRVAAIDMSDALHHRTVEVISPTMDIRFDDVPHGEYAIMAFHDMSHSARLDTNFIGIPCEDLCISNNVKGGPRGGPKWDTAKFTHSSSKVTKLDSVKMAHMHKG